MNLYCKFYFIILYIFLQFTCKGQYVTPYWTVDPPQYGWPKVYCKGDCVQFVDSSIITNPFIAGDTLITNWFWFFTGTSNKQIPYNSSIFGSPQPFYPFASDTIKLFKKLNPPPMCYDSVGLFEATFTVRYSTGHIPGVIYSPQSIKIIDAPIYIGADKQYIKLRFGDEHTLTACAEDSKYAWEPSNDIGCSTCANYTIKPFSNTTYTCTITNANGCEKKCVYMVELENPPETFYIPNSFTPNNDGLNDIFKPISLNQKIVSFSIYNRWGQKLMESNDENASWDGMHKGLKAEEGVYTYVILYSTVADNDSVKKLSGIVNLIR